MPSMSWCEEIAFTGTISSIFYTKMKQEHTKKFHSTKSYNPNTKFGRRHLRLMGSRPPSMEKKTLHSHKKREVSYSGFTAVPMLIGSTCTIRSSSTSFTEV